MNTERFSTQDVPLVAYLHAKKHTILETSNKDNRNRVTFFFQKNSRLVEDMYTYTNNQPFPVQDFYRSLAYIWSVIKRGGV